MTSLRGSLPPAGSTLWQKERRSSSLDSSKTSSSLITHIVIREVWKKTIPSPHALYKIDVMTKSNHWYVLKRYREFSNLHKMLVNAYGIPKDMLPPKKITSKLSLKHLERRRDALEHYLQRLVNSSTYVSSSPEVLEFLDVNKHDVNAVTKSLAKNLLKVGDSVLTEGGSYTFTLTQLYCITRQLQLPEPATTNEDHSPLDLGHLYSFVYQLEELCIIPDRCQGSQGMMGHLEFDISLFKALRSLKIDRCPVYLIKSLHMLQPQLKYFAVRHSLKTMGELLVDKVIGKRKESMSAGSAVESWRNQATTKLTKNRVILQPWIQLTNLTLPHNNISMFDESLKLMPALQTLDLRYNNFALLDFQQMNCPSLTHLDISYNSISQITGNCKNLPNLKSLILSHNKLDNLIALHSMTGLIELDLAYNNLGTLKELRNLRNMSQLRYLSVDGNSLTKVKSYRLQIFSLFCGRKIILDNKPQGSSDNNASGTMWTRSRSFSTPDSFTRDDDDDIVRLVRANSEVSPTPANCDDSNDGSDDDDDDDSGIEAIASFSTNIAANNTNQEELEFNWSYFDFLDTGIGNRGIFSSGTEASTLEEQIKEEMCDESMQITSSTESADEVVVDQDSNINNDDIQEEENASDVNVATLDVLSPIRTESDCVLPKTVIKEDSNIQEGENASDVNVATLDALSSIRTASDCVSQKTAVNEDSNIQEEENSHDISIEALDALMPTGTESKSCLLKTVEIEGHNESIDQESESEVVTSQTSTSTPVRTKEPFL